MSGGKDITLVCDDLKSVQDRIELCLKHYMNKKEIINVLIQGSILPSVTEIVWGRLERENPEFFRAYHLKLMVKDQIMEFNRLLSEQADLMRRINLNGISPYLPSNGLHIPPTQHISITGPTQNFRPVRPEGMQQANMFNNCGPANQLCLQGAISGPVHGRNINVSPNLPLPQRNINVSPNLPLPQNADMGLSEMINGKSVEPKAGYAGTSTFVFSPPRNYLEPRPLMGDASVSSFSSVDSNPQHLNDTLLDGDTSSFGFLPQIPQTFPELPADFAIGSDLLESYCRSPFLPADANNFMNHQGDVGNLDPESESLRFHCFGSD